jgi:hypothetical protein
MISIDVAAFEAACAQRPAGYREHVLSLGKIAHGRLWLRPEDHTYLANFYRGQELPEPRWNNARNLLLALGKWAKAGFPVASQETLKHRARACRACPHWSDEARGGLGKCHHHACGCTRLKWWLQTEKCPDGRWTLT